METDGNMQSMSHETDGTRQGATSGERRLPLDVRIVPYFFYFVAFGQVPLGILFWTGVTTLVGSYRVFFGLVVVANEKAAGVYAILIGICWLSSAWGLMRRKTFSWWFAMIFSMYYLTDEALQFSRSPRDFAIGAAIQISLVAWLWYRRRYWKGDTRDAP